MSGLKADLPVAPTDALAREVAEVACPVAQQPAPFELQGWQEAARAPRPAGQQLVPALARRSAGRRWWPLPCKGTGRFFEVVDLGPQGVSSHIPGRLHRHHNRLEEEPLWNKVSDEAPAAAAENGIRHDTTVILYGRNTTAAARAAHLMMYASGRRTPADGGLDAWFVQHLRTETGLANKFEPVKEFGVAIPAHPEYYTTLSQAKELKRFKQPDSALVSVRTWDEFVGNTSGLQLHRPRATSQAKWGHGGGMPTA